MSDHYKSKITRDEYLRAFALFTMAHEHYVQSGNFGEAVNKIIMITPEKYPGGHVDDLIYSDGPLPVAAFDDALKKEGIQVEVAKKPKATKTKRNRR